MGYQGRAARTHSLLEGPWPVRSCYMAVKWLPQVGVSGLLDRVQL